MKCALGLSSWLSLACCFTAIRLSFSGSSGRTIGFCWSSFLRVAIFFSSAAFFSCSFFFSASFCASVLAFSSGLGGGGGGGGGGGISSLVSSVEPPRLRSKVCPSCCARTPAWRASFQSVDLSSCICATTSPPVPKRKCAHTAAQIHMTRGMVTSRERIVGRLPWCGLRLQVTYRSTPRRATPAAFAAGLCCNHWTIRWPDTTQRSRPFRVHRPHASPQLLESSPHVTSPPSNGSGRSPQSARARRHHHGWQRPVGPASRSRPFRGAPRRGRGRTPRRESGAPPRAPCPDPVRVQ